MEWILERGNGFLRVFQMLIVESVAVYFLHDVRSAPPACTQHIGVRNLLSVEVRRKEVAERVERVRRFYSELFLFCNEPLCDYIRVQCGNVPALTDPFGDMMRKQDRAIRCGRFRLFDYPHSEIIQYHVFADVEIVAV